MNSFVIISSVLLSTWVSALPGSPTTALSEYQKQDWQVEDGLPQSNVRAIAQVPGGPLLIGTSGGLVSFDGLHFSPIKVDASDDLANEPINALLISHAGLLWIGTDDRGVVRQKGKETIALSEDSGFHQERIRALAEDQSGTIWVATQNGVERIRNEKIERLTSLGLISGDITSPFAEDGRGNMFILTSKGLFLWRPSGVQSFPFHNHLGDVTAAYSRGKDTVWIGFSGGLVTLTVQPDGSYTQTQQQNIRGPVRVLLQDSDGYVWAGTRDHGLCRVSPRGLAYWSVNEGLSDHTIRSLFEDDEGDIWIGTMNGGMSRWRKSTLIPFGETEGLPSDFAANVLGDRRSDLWLGTWGHGLLRIHDGKLERERTGAALSDPIRALAEDKLGNVWIGTWFSGLYRYNGKGFQHFLIGTESPANAVSALLIDKEGALWVGTYKGLIRFWNGIPGKNRGEVFLADKLITSIQEVSEGSIIVGTFSGLYMLTGLTVHEITKEDGLSSPFILSTSTDSLGGVWVGTKAGGVDFIRGQRAIHIAPESGIPAYPVSSVLDDGSGMLWISTTRGLLRVPVKEMHDLVDGNRQTVDAVLLGKSDGMRSSECRGVGQPAATRMQDGTLWFTTSKGFVHTRTSALPFSAAPLEVRIEGLSLDNTLLPPSGQVTLAPGMSDLEFEFDATRLANPYHLQFRYKLDGYDRDWTLARGRHAHYRRLPPGHYRFLVSARDAGMAWDDKLATVFVEQKPFFYQTWWFYAAIGITLTGAIVALFLMRVARIKGRMSMVIEERNRIAREWHDTLMAGFAAISWQLEATKERFLAESSESFSSLNLARNMVRHCQAEARRIIWDLRDGTEPVGPLSRILSRELDRMSGRLDVPTHFRVHGEEASLTPADMHHLVCICQEAVTNAIRHAAPKTIEVGLEYHAARIMLSVKDDGHGFQLTPPAASQHGHFGITVMQERAQKLGGRLQVHSSPGSGTEILVEVPTPTGAGKL
jgi:signal transduction histidine kinase/ligand-binding sensor domain-containing protein